ncbi:MAG: alpha-amylase [Vibrio sp.]|uniref:alpha-amylase n=1 Tax=Vibrio sp. TaxID=678 RepID=UPI003F310E29
MKRNTLTLALLSTLSLPVLAAPNLTANLTIATTTNSRDFPLAADAPLVIPLTKGDYTLTISGIEGDCAATTAQEIKFNTPFALNCHAPTQLPLNIRFTGDYAFQWQAQNNTLTLVRQTTKAATSEFRRRIPNVSCQTYQGGEVALNLANSFADGTQLRDAFTGQVVTVNQGQVRLTPSTDSGGLVLLEPVAEHHPIQAQPFTYRNANIYFVMIDRFYNGDPSNDGSYGRQKDGQQEIGTFHGGDLKGVIAKLDHIQSLGTDAIWLSPIVEQVHGFVGGGEKGSFPFYAYHGYWTRDFTKIDANFGVDEDLQTLVREAHRRGIKILLDAVLNHAGYATLADLQQDAIEIVNAPMLPERWSQWQPTAKQNWHSFHQAIDYQSPKWSQWWGGDWVRAGLPGYPKPGSSDITMNLAGLPDFRTESTQAVSPPQWLLNNPGTRVVNKPGYSVTDYLVEWQTDWVRRFGIDGFRIDTVKHVEGAVWQRLKQQATASLNAWRQEHNQTGEPFWMMGEVWGHGAYRSPYFDDGFDALINFDIQKRMDNGAACLSQMAMVYRDYAQTLSKYPDFNPVSYMSSHDTELFFGRFKSFEMQRSAANALLLTPGAVQVYYGDEVAREAGPYADDFHQGTRSDMPWEWNNERQALLKHWQTLGQFRQRHPAIGAGEHREIAQANAYLFTRQLGEDKVVVAFVGR